MLPKRLDYAHRGYSYYCSHGQAVAAEIHLTESCGMARLNLLNQKQLKNDGNKLDYS